MTIRNYTRRDSQVSEVSEPDPNAEPLSDAVSTISDSSHEQKPRPTSSYYGSSLLHQTFIAGNRITAVEAFPALPTDYNSTTDVFGGLGFDPPPPNQQYMPEPISVQEKALSYNPRSLRALTSHGEGERVASVEASKSQVTGFSYRRHLRNDPCSRCMCVTGFIFLMIALAGIGIAVWTIIKS